jgi:hypothetical protein
MRRAVLILLVVVTCWAGRAVAAPVLPLPVLPPDAPAYGQAEFLADAMATLELAVVGMPRGGELRIQRVLAGTPRPELLVRKKVVRIVGPRFTPRAGLWLLVRAKEGYYAVNPTAAPLPEAAWKTLAPALPAVPGLSVAVEVGPERVSIDLGEHMSESLTVQFDGAGRLMIVHHAPKHGPGLWLNWDAGVLREFSRTLDGQLDGLERDFDTQGRPEGESTWRRGLRHGPTRAWKDGKLTRDVVYEDNLELPIMRWSGKPGPVVLERHEVYNLYTAPEKLRDQLRVGMTAAQVLALLQVDFSLPDGLNLAYRCAMDLHVGFKAGVVSQIAPKTNGTICDP